MGRVAPYVAQHHIESELSVDASNVVIFTWRGGAVPFVGDIRRMLYAWGLSYRKYFA